MDGCAGTPAVEETTPATEQMFEDAPACRTGLRDARAGQRTAATVRPPAPADRRRDGARSGTSVASQSASHTSRGAHAGGERLACRAPAERREHEVVHDHAAVAAPNSSSTAIWNSLSFIGSLPDMPSAGPRTGRSVRMYVAMDAVVSAPSCPRRTRRRARRGGCRAPRLRPSSTAMRSPTSCMITEMGVSSASATDARISRRGLFLTPLDLAQVPERDARLGRDLPERAPLLQSEVPQHIADLLSNQNHRGTSFYSCLRLRRRPETGEPVYLTLVATNLAWHTGLSCEPRHM